MITRRLFFALFLLFPSLMFGQIATHVVISEVYGGGGNSGATWNHDYIELYNPTGSTVSLTGWSVQYASAGGSTWSVTALTGSIAAHSFHLVQESSNNLAVGAPSPLADDSGTIAMSGSNGKVCLVNTTTALTTVNPTDLTIVDKVGYGTVALTLGYEGTGPTGTSLSSTTAAERKASSSSTAVSMASGGGDELLGNGYDSDDNSIDFVVQTSTNPQNSSSSMETPPAGNQGPGIAAVTRSTFVPSTGATDSVKATITDADGTIAGAKVHLRVNGGAYDSSLTMVSLGGTLYGALVPAAKHVSNGDKVEYFVSATDDSGAYASTASTLGGYYVGDAPISTIKADTITAITGYGARVNGVLNVKTNVLQNGGTFLQDATGGIHLFLSGMPSLDAGRNARVEGTLKAFSGGYEIADPSFRFVDTTGSSALTPTVITLPIAAQSPTNANEGRLVKINSLTTDSTGTYAASRSYVYKDGSLDTITVFVQSNASANTTVGAAIPAVPVDAVGVLQYFNTFLELKPRRAEDMGASAALTFEAVATGNWTTPGTWSSGVVPDSNDNVTMTTLNVVVTVDVATARCKNLTMTGTGSAATSGPVLQFNATGSPQLTVYGDLRLNSGGSGGAANDWGGRAKLTSNGNTSATLRVKGDVTTFPSNAVTAGDAGLNMNEGTVKLIGTTSDTLRNSAGLRLGNLEIGDGTGGKTMVWRPKTAQDLAIRSLRVRPSATFWIGNDSSGTTGGLGYFGTDSLPTLTGGITIDAGGALRVEDFASGVNNDFINLDGGGITNNGTLDLRVGAVNLPGEAVASGCSYTVAIGGIPVGSPSSSQSIGGSAVGSYGGVHIYSGHTLTLNRDMDLGFFTMRVDGNLVETAGNTVLGTVTATRVLAQSVADTFGGIGATINAAGGVPDTTTVTRVTGVAQTGGTGTSILRYYDIDPKNNAGLNADLDLLYDDSELAGQTAATLQLWKSTDAGASWNLQSSSVNTGQHKVSTTGVNTFSRWTAADPAHALGGTTVEYTFNGGWNMVSVPLIVGDYRKTILFPTSTSNAFFYAGAYDIEDTLKNGIGYWLKFADIETVGVVGSARTLDTVDVVAGWNLIGTLSANAPIAAITQLPPSITVSPYYGYAGSYSPEDTLAPAKGYWVKTNADGKLVLSSGGPSKAVARRDDLLDGLSWLTVRDANGYSQKLYVGTDDGSGVEASAYELPPLPPKGSFDARFASGRFVALAPRTAHRETELPISVQATAYPLTVSWHVQAAAAESFSLRTGAPAAVPMHGDGEVSLAKGSPVIVVTSGAALPKEFALGNNYPNPFNPSTRFTVALPLDANVDVAVYNLLGQRLRTLVAGPHAAGEFSVEWDGTSDNGSPMASGIYILRMQSNEFNAAHKMMLMR